MAGSALQIAFDGRVIRAGKSGVGVYAESLLSALSSIDKKSAYKVLSNEVFKSLSRNFSSVQTNVSIESHPFGDLWEQFYLPAYLKGNKVDVFHSPTFHIPFVSGRFKKVVTIHDLVSFRTPQTQPRGFTLYSRFMTRFASLSADAIIVPSRTVKSELVGLLNVSPEVLHVIPEAPRGMFRPASRAECESVKSKYGLSGSFILTVGSIEPRKNIPSLIRAYSLLRQRGKTRHKLVICGAKGWMREHERIQGLIGDLGIGNDVVFTGYVPDEDLPAMYTLADLFVYPSLYEGFGLPPLEAMACGCPVVASNCSAIPEVVGDAGVLVEPMDADGISEAMQSVMEDEGLKRRLCAAGFARAREFSWEKTARETLKIYMAVMGR
ncbi:MAG: glycosyltransferase family 4 protein [Deltaproteobacteria bacterium]|nr:glycosyltransferase family 4 protein [Deltaproteobacteria bacterium]